MYFNLPLQMYLLYSFSFLVVTVGFLAREYFVSEGAEDNMLPVCIELTGQTEILLQITLIVTSLSAQGVIFE